MVRASALIASVALTSCSAPSNDSIGMQIAEQRTDMAALRSRVDAQDAQIKLLQQQQEELSKLAQATATAHESLVDTFNGNVRINNEGLRRERTALGVCGQEQVWNKDGTYVLRNKDCPAPQAK